MTLDDIKRMKPLVNIALLSTSLGLERTTLDQRIRRGTPELSADEAQKVADVLRLCGLMVRPKRTPTS